MEHSLLHALQLAGIITALGGTFFVLFFLHPARRDPPLAMLAGEWERISASWSFWAASLGALGTIIDIFVQVAEIRGATIYGGVNPEDIFKFATGTVVGQIACAKAMFLICLAGSLKWNGKFRWVCALVLGIAASVTSSLVSHSAALPAHRTAAITAQISHIIMGSAWIGVLIQLFAGKNFFTGNTPIATAKLLAFILKRFSPIAITALTLIVFSGFYAVWRFLQTPMAALTSPYGLTLSLKLVLLLILLRAGWVNWQIARPAILQITKDPAELFTKKGESIFAQFSRTLELEVTAGLLVITVAGILGGIAPPGEEGLYRLNAQEMSALATPDLPTTRIVDPAKFVGANERTLDDLRYAEFTHNWSGIIVLLLGICWLAESSSRQRIFSRLWPLLLVPFGFFIAVAADPEIWILRNVSVLQGTPRPAID